MKHCSIVVVHYSNPDDSGEEWGKTTDDPEYSRSNLLRRCLKSIKENTDYPAELIVIDNGGEPDDSTYLLQRTREGLINTYIRNKENMNFGWAWNMAKKIATGNYICLTCNDVFFKPKWLSTCIKLFERYDDGRTFVAPYLTKDKVNLIDKDEGVRKNPMGGSNCMIGTKRMFDTIGDYSTSRKAGTFWQRTLARMGYVVCFPTKNYATDMGTMGGQNFEAKSQIVKTLLNGEIIDYTYIEATQ